MEFATDQLKISYIIGWFEKYDQVMEWPELSVPIL